MDFVYVFCCFFIVKFLDNINEFQYVFNDSIEKLFNKIHQNYEYFLFQKLKLQWQDCQNHQEIGFIRIKID